MKNLPIVVFDVNETLLDLETTAPFFERCRLQIGGGGARHFNCGA